MAYELVDGEPRHPPQSRVHLPAATSANEAEASKNSKSVNEVPDPCPTDWRGRHKAPEHQPSPPPSGWGSGPACLLLRCRSPRTLSWLPATPRTARRPSVRFVHTNIPANGPTAIIAMDAPAMGLPNAINPIPPASAVKPNKNANHWPRTSRRKSAPTTADSSLRRCLQFSSACRRMRSAEPSRTAS